VGCFFFFSSAKFFSSSATCAKPLGERGGIIPLPSGHETLEAGSLCGRLGLEFGLNALQLGKGLGGIAQLQPAHCGHQTVRGWRLQRIHAQLFAFT
jgi:hypothetical protein